MWTTSLAHDFCVLVEAIAPSYGCHVALTGGCLYKGGERKDLDILFYRIRQVEKIDTDGLFEALKRIGLHRDTRAGVWCVKATWRQNGSDRERRVDCFFPELDGEYTRDATEDPQAQARVGE